MSEFSDLVDLINQPYFDNKLDLELSPIIDDLVKIMQDARERWDDSENDTDSFILFALAYLGRSTSAARNDDIDKYDMLLKCAGLLLEAAIREDRLGQEVK